MMEAHYSLPDTEFADQFKNATLNPQLFSHEAHLRLAWIHVHRYGVEQAAKNICEQIARFDRKFGDGTKFNETVTIAAVKAVAHFMNRSDSQTFQELIMEFPRLKNNFKDLLKHHYSFDVFRSENARRSYVEPDLIPF